jgi:putative acetyltransferase
VHRAPATTSENNELEPVIGSIETEADVQAFHALNEEWIHRYFTMEAADRAALDDPFRRVVAAGGDVLIVRVGAERVGCVALVPTGNGVYELSKMAVTPELQGRGIGRKLLLAAIERARALGATSIFLGSNTKLASAIHLYESVGFAHVAPEQIGPMPYERANVFMELVL